MTILRTGNKSGKRHTAVSTQQGLTLVEVLVSIAILATGSILILQSLAKGSQALAIAKKRSKVYSFSAAKLTDLEMSYRGEGPEKMKGHFGVGYDRFNWHIAISPTPDSAELIFVTLIVDWRIGRHNYESRFSTVQLVPVVEEE